MGLSDRCPLVDSFYYLSPTLFPLMKKIELICYIIIGIVIAIGTTVSYANPTFFAEKLTVEDGPFEWITVFMLFITGCLMLRRAILLRNARTKIFILITAGAGLLMWFGAGEELSWGQRIFGIEASDWLKENNTQDFPYSQSVNLKSKLSPSALPYLWLPKSKSSCGLLPWACQKS